MKINLEKINKTLFLFGLALLIFRNGSFSNSFAIKPFEGIFLIVTVLTIVDIIKNKKYQYFFSSIQKKVWIALACLLGAIFIGWGVALFFVKIPVSFNAVLEFGNFVISIGTFLLVLFFTKNDDTYAKKILYVLLVPAAYMIFLIFPGMAGHFGLAQNGTFNGFTDNVNLVSKMLLIPALFFATYAIYEVKSISKMMGYIALSVGMMALIFWTAERGAILSVVLGIMLVWLIFSIKGKRNPKEILLRGLMTIGIICLGFLLVPYSGKLISLDRLLNPEIHQSTYAELQGNSIISILYKSLSSSRSTAMNTGSESRFYIWTYYLKQTVKNPLGFGPNTHMPAYIVSSQAVFSGPGPHNTYIEALLWGGIIGLFSFLYVIFTAYKNIGQYLLKNDNKITIALLAILTSLSVAVIFNDSLILPWLWAIYALSMRLWNDQVS